MLSTDYIGITCSINKLTKSSINRLTKYPINRLTKCSINGQRACLECVRSWVQAPVGSNQRL